MARTDLPEPPADAPPAVRTWIDDQLGDQARVRDSLVGVVHAAVRRRKQQDGHVPDEVLRGWSWVLDDGRRKVNQSERVFIEETRAAGWTDDAIRLALCLDANTDLDRRAQELDGLVHQHVRPAAS